MRANTAKSIGRDLSYSRGKTRNVAKNRKNMVNKTHRKYRKEIATCQKNGYNGIRGRFHIFPDGSFAGGGRNV
jgi:hypothetical protein